MRPRDSVRVPMLPKSRRRDRMPPPALRPRFDVAERELSARDGAADIVCSCASRSGRSRARSSGNCRRRASASKDARTRSAGWRRSPRRKRRQKRQLRLRGPRCEGEFEEIQTVRTQMYDSARKKRRDNWRIEPAAAAGGAGRARATGRTDVNAAGESREKEKLSGVRLAQTSGPLHVSA